MSAIVKESAEAACVVLGTREWHPYRIFGRSTSMGVASRAWCPVVAVPPSWSEASEAGRVVVGVDHDAGPAVVLQRAFEEAHARGAELTIVHAWAPPHAYEPHWPGLTLTAGAKRPQPAARSSRHRAEPTIPASPSMRS